MTPSQVSAAIHSADADRLRSESFADAMAAKRCQAVLDRAYRERGIVANALTDPECALYASWRDAFTMAAQARRDMADHIEGRL